MIKNKKAQTFVSLIALILGIIIFILASPIVYQIIIENVPSMGSATAFVVKLFLWLIMLVLIAYFIKVFSSGGEFFTQ